LENGARINIIAGGTLQVNDTLTVNTDYFNVYGALEINGTLLGSTVVTLSSGSTLAGAGGTINITAPGYLAIASYSNSNWEGSLTNEGEVRLSSSSATINVNNLSFVNNGLFELLQGGTVNINDSGGTNSFINNGTVKSIAAINFNVPFTNNTGGTVIGSKQTAFGSTFSNNSGATLMGNGFDFSGATVTNEGIVDLKNSIPLSPQTMFITGNFSFGTSSTTLIEVGEFSHYVDKLAITGTANIGGTLEVTLFNSYTPVLDDSWEILTAASLSGTFDTVNLPTLDSGLEWNVNYSATNITLQVIEEGATFEDLTITLAGDGSGTVTSAPSGIDCGTTCDFSFQTDTFIILYANADTGSVFTGWSGDCDTHMLTITAATSCTATFELDTDQDGLVDTFETSIGTNPNDPDTDADGYSDYYNEVGHGDTLDTYTPGVDTDPNNPDTDGDGYYDGVEAFFWSDPLDPTSISTVICVNTNSDSEAANHHSYGPPSISSDGRYVAFYSLATNLNECDTTAYNDIYLKDTLTGQISVQSTNSAGECLNVSYRSSSDPSISFDSRYVAFESNVDTLTDNDTNGVGDIFLKDTQTNTTTLVSTDSNEVQANDSNETPSVSGDGRYVVFRTSATNLVAEDTDTSTDLILKDTQTGDTTLVSSDSSGTKGNDDSYPQAISYNGRYVVFKSYATNLVADDTNDEGDIFLKDTVTGETTRVSTDSSGAQANGYSDYPAISSDGRYVVFRSYATNLVDNDTNGVEDIFLKDMTTGETTRVSTDSNNTEANAISMYSDISDDGRYVVFSSDATNLIAGDDNLKRDIFVKDMESGETARVNESVTGVQANNKSDYPVISGDGNFIAFESDATTLVGRCNSGATDIIRIQNPLIGQTYYELSLTLAGYGSGTVTSDPAGINLSCRYVCHSFRHGRSRLRFCRWIWQ
jgi:hypothetical protein